MSDGPEDENEMYSYDGYGEVHPDAFFLLGDIVLDGKGGARRATQDDMKDPKMVALTKKALKEYRRRRSEETVLARNLQLACVAFNKAIENASNAGLRVQPSVTSGGLFGVSYPQFEVEVLRKI